MVSATVDTYPVTRGVGKEGFAIYWWKKSQDGDTYRKPISMCV